MKYILGVDPGSTESALVIINTDLKVVEQYYDDNFKIEEILANWPHKANSDLAIEFIQSYGMAVGQEVFLTCRWVGRFERAYYMDDKTFLYPRPSIKAHIVGSSRGKDADVARALKLRLGGIRKGEPLEGISKPNHKYAALAVAVTHADGCVLGLDGWMQLPARSGLVVRSDKSKERAKKRREKKKAQANDD